MQSLGAPTAPSRISSLDKTRAISAAIAIGFFGWFAILGFGLDRDQPEFRYFVTDWMVTYAGGFVRRGFLGQSFVTIGSLTHLHPLALILSARVLVQTIFLSVLGSLCFRNRRALGPWGMLLILANPFVGLYTWYFAGSFDLAFILLTVAHLALTKRLPGPRYLVAAFLLFSGLGVMIALSHEAFMFFCLPINLLIAWRSISSGRLQKTVAIFGLSVLASVAALRFHGDHAQVTRVADSWREAGVELPTFNALRYLPNTAADQLADVVGYLNLQNVVFWAVSNLLCACPLAYLWFRNLRSLKLETVSQLKRRIVQYFLVPIAITIPIYFVGDDWHRWICIPVTTGILCLLIDLPQIDLLQIELGPSNKRAAGIYAGLLVLSLLARPLALYTPKVALLGGALPSSAALVVRHTTHSRFGLR